MQNHQQEQQKLEERSVKIEEDYRNPYFRDQTKIIHSKAFRRLKDKTQVFADPENDHVCTRVEHVLHVATVAKSICCGLKKKFPDWHLNEDLAFAIGLGHDLGHAPFGHTGEKVLDNRLQEYNLFFKHEINGYRIVEKLERLNLTYAVKDGIICHNGEEFEQSIKPRRDKNGELIYKDLNAIKDRNNNPISFEGCIARFSDKIAYLGRDIEDAFLFEMIKKRDIPEDILSKVGGENCSIISFFIDDLMSNSSEQKAICFSESAHKLLTKLRDFNYSSIYHHKLLQKSQKGCEMIVSYLFDYFYKLQRQYDFEIKRYFRDNSQDVNIEFGEFLKEQADFYLKEKKTNQWPEGVLAAQITSDYISGMTDDYAISTYKKLVVPFFCNN